MSSPSSTLTDKLLQVEGKALQRTYSVSDLLAIDSTVLDSTVHFVRPSKTGTIGTTYGSDEYDRTSIYVSRRGKLALDLPERGRRMYQDGMEVSLDNLPAGGSALEGLAQQLKHATILDDDSAQEITIPNSSFVYAGGPPSPPPKQRSSNLVTALVDGDSDEDDSDRALAFYMRRPGTPLPSLFLKIDDSNEDENPTGSRVFGGQEEVLSPLVNVSRSDESDGSPCVNPTVEIVSAGKLVLVCPPNLLHLTTSRMVAGKDEIDFQPQQSKAGRANTIAMADRTPSLTSDGTCSSDESEGPMSPQKCSTTGTIVFVTGSTSS